MKQQSIITIICIINLPLYVFYVKIITEIYLYFALRVDHSFSPPPHSCSCSSILLFPLTLTSCDQVQLRQGRSTATKRRNKRPP